MKKILALLLAALLLLGLTACGGKTETPVPGDDPAPAATPEADPAADLPSFTFTQYGDARITIVGAQFDQDDEGEDFLRVYYDYTNTSDTAINSYPNIALDFASVTQDGEECAVFSLYPWDECALPEDLGYDNGVLPGCTNRHTMLVRCDPDGGVIEISCYIMIGSWVYNPDEIDLFTFQIDPDDMMGAPEPLEIPAITTPSYAVGLPTYGSSDYPMEYELSIDAWTLTYGYDGETVLQVMHTMTNLSDEALHPGGIAQVEAYQDGIALEWFDSIDLANPTDADEAFSEDLYPGETVCYNTLFLLRNESPVEVVAEQSNDELRLGTVCDVKALMDAIKAQQQEQLDAINAANAQAIKELLGIWDRTDGWDDQITFNADGTGLHDMTGDVFPFTFTLDDGFLCIYYDDGDYAEYDIEVSGNDLTFTDYFDDIQTFVRAGTDEAPVEEVDEPEEVEEPEEVAVALENYLIGTWKDHESGYGETFTFYADGTGVYSYYEDGHWEFGFTYEVCEDDSVDIYFDDGDIGGFWIEMEDEDTMLITNSAVIDMVFVRE